MVYSNHFVVCVLVDGKPQKERKDGIVLVPYGAEYALRFRNKHGRRAVVKFTIDGEDVSGPGYIVPAHGAIDIQRHHIKDATFKFVSIDSPEAVDHGKNDNSDGSKGVVEAKFFLETEVKLPVEHHHHHHYPPTIINPPNPWKPYKPYPPVWYGSTDDKWPNLSNPRSNLSYNASCGGGKSSCSGSYGASACSGPNVAFGGAPNLGSLNFGDGCTVEGDASGQMFGQSWINLETDFVAIRVVLKGVDAPVHKVVNEEYCTGCGAKRLRKADRFCGACGHRL